MAKRAKKRRDRRRSDRDLEDTEEGDGEEEEDLESSNESPRKQMRLDTMGTITEEASSKSSQLEGTNVSLL